MFRTIMDKIQDIKSSMYIKRMQRTHEAFSNYGLSLDYNTYMEFNREVLIRKIVEAERLIEKKHNEVNGIFTENIDAEITNRERIRALNKILVLIDQGILSEETLDVISSGYIVL